MHSQRRSSKPDYRKLLAETKAIFVVWGTPDQGPRSRVLARKLGIDAFFVQTAFPRGALYAPLKYLVQATKTAVLLARERPQVIFVQSPPLFAVLVTYVFCALRNAVFLVDAHSAALLGPWWSMPPHWLKRRLSQAAVATLVTNDQLGHRVEDIGGRAIVLSDIPTTFDVAGAYPLPPGFSVAVINTSSIDEPLSETLQAAVGLPGVNFLVTGRLDRRTSALVSDAPPNVHFTGFLADADYYALLNSVQAVLCLTTRNHTMQRGASEALWLGTPIITSDWPLLRDYFDRGTVHVDNSVDGIRQGVSLMQADHPRFQEEIRNLQILRRREWHEKIGDVLECITKDSCPTDEFEPVGSGIDVGKDGE